MNSVSLGPVSRGDHGTILTCLASNTNNTVPVSSRVTIDMILPPSHVSITTPPHPVSAGTEYILECDTTGSVPSIIVTWYRGTQILGDKERISFTPTHQDRGEVITCRAENPAIQDSAIQDTWTPTIFCK